MYNKENILERIKIIARNFDNEKILNKYTGEENHMYNQGILINKWDPVTLSSGYPGIILLYSELERQFPYENWKELKHKFIGLLVDQIHSTGLNSTSMFSGISGVATAVFAASNNREDYSKLLSKLNELLVYNIKLELDNMDIKNAKMEDYDIIEGLAGKLNYLLLVSDDEKNREIISKVLNKLIVYTNDKEYLGRNIMGFHISPNNMFLEFEKEMFPNGFINTGFAHGISGVLMSLVNAANKNIIVEGQIVTIEKIMDILLKSIIRNNKRMYWDYVISFEEFINKKKIIFDKKLTSYRDAWCYGVPGISLALYSAADFLKKENIKMDLIEALKESFNYSTNIDGPILCHGFGGNLVIYNEIKKLSKSKELDEIILNSIERIEEYYDDEYEFGYYNIENINGVRRRVNDPAFLDGALGVLLVLIDFHLGSKTNWKVPLGIISI